MSDHPSQNPVIQGLQVLITSPGYNFYNSANMMRADDLLVRGQASGALGEACAALKAVEGEYTHRFIPPATRENPYPPAGAMEKLRGLVRLRERISGLESGIRGMAVPTQDKIWWRFHQEARLLNDLLVFDHGLLLHTAEVARLAQGITADAWQSGDAAAPLLAALQQLDSLVRDRQRLLSLS